MAASRRTPHKVPTRGLQQPTHCPARKRTIEKASMPRKCIRNTTLSMHRPQSGAREPQLGAHASQLAPLQQSTSSHIGARRLALLTMLTGTRFTIHSEQAFGSLWAVNNTPKTGAFQPHQTPNSPILFAHVSFPHYNYLPCSKLLFPAECHH